MANPNDDQRIFQALCTEMERLQREFNNGKVDAATVSHCASLRDRYAAMISGSIETGDVVRVLRHDGSLGYYGEVVDLPAAKGSGRVAAIGRYAVRTPDEEIHYVPRSCVVPATESESDDYIARWVDKE